MRKWIAALAAVLVLAAACTGSGGEGQGTSASPTSEPWRGGTLRLALVGGYFWSLGPEWALDPQKVYDTHSWELLPCLLRTLFSYNGLPASEGGAEARPDLAAGPPEISVDELTWTIHIKKGIHYAPPLQDVEITAQDFVRALMREAAVGRGWSPTRYQSVIEGWVEYASGKADTISGLETPDGHTLVVRLTEPAGDLPNRLAMAATAPIPPNPYRPDAVLGAAQGHDRTYGLYLVASGPYMIEGSEDLDLSLRPKDQEPIAGYMLPKFAKDGSVVSPGSLTLVRNPSWDPASDDLRAAYADRIELQVRAEGLDSGTPSYRAAARELAAAVEAGTVDHVLDLPYTASQIDRYRADPEIQRRVTTVPNGAIYYIMTNLAVPPFNDLHVRRAIAFAIDRDEILRTLSSDPKVRPWFEANQPVVATHVSPDSVEGGLLADYDPYPTSLEQAKREMTLSRYDRDGDGRCDAPECRRVLAIAGADEFGRASADKVAAWLQEIGIGLRVEVGDPYEALNEREKVPLSMGGGWMYDYPNASTIFQPLFSSSFITGHGGYNSSLLGATPAQLREWGYDVTKVPSVDDRIDYCMAMTGANQTECWSDLDRYLMEDVVPWIPYAATTATLVVSQRVATCSYSVATGGLALDRIALVEGSD